MRLRVCNNTPVVLCVQLLKYTGTSVTNAVEDICLKTFLHLWGKGVFEVQAPKTLL